jgi:magnesium chelatase subunit D
MRAKATLGKVTLQDDLLKTVSKACLDLKVDGLRPDIVIAKSASALVAFEDRTEVTLNDVLVAADLALSHRTREGGFLEPATPQEIVEVFSASAKKMLHFEKTGEAAKEEADKRKSVKGRGVFWVKKDASKEEEQKTEEDSWSNKIQNARLRLSFLLGRFTGGVWGIGKRLKSAPKDTPETDALQVGGDKLQGQTYEKKVTEKENQPKAYPTVSETANSMQVSQGFTLLSSLEHRIVSPSKFFLTMSKIKTKKTSVYAGKHAQTVTSLHRGRPYGWRVPHGKPADIHIPATIREAARRQAGRERPLDTALRISLEDIRENLRVDKASMTMVFVVDLSGSMLYNVEAVREALLRLHGDAYRSRDRVGIVALKGLSAEVVQHPITNLRVVANKLVSMRISGFTPLAAGMYKGLEVLKEAKRRSPSTVPVMVIVTDGSANVPLKKSIETGEVRQIDESLAAVREYEDLAVSDAYSVARMVKREGIHVVVVNTNPHIYGRESYGFEVTEQVASLTGGTHHSIGRLTTEKEMIDNMIKYLREDQRSIIPGRNAD